MQGQNRRLCIGLLFAAACLARPGAQSQALTWQETEARFKANNPSLLAGQLTIEEARADEITAALRPNPDFTLTTDGTQIAPSQGVWRPFSGTLVTPAVSYLHERQHKRELRLESAQQATAIAMSTQLDLERTLTFNLRDAFVRVLQSKAVLELAKENLKYYDTEIGINRERYESGAIAEVDYQRLQLQRIQFQADLATAQVNLRTAKIDLLTLIRDRTPVEEFDVTGDFDFSEASISLNELHALALNTRPDLKQAQQAIEKSRTDHQLAIANGSTDPTFGAWLTHNGSFNNPAAFNTMGASVSIPLRIFDRNQGEKLHTSLDIERSRMLRDAAEQTVFHDVDSAYATLQSTLEILRPYKATYLEEALAVRSTVSFAYQHGAASLLDFLDAQKQFRDTELNYLNLVGSYLSAANQLNLSVGREVIR